MKSIRKLIQRPLLATAALALLGSLATPAFAGKTIDAIKARGTLNCGVNPSLPGFAAADSQGVWAGLDVDVCKAVAATLLNDPTKIKYTPLNEPRRFFGPALYRHHLL
jgi:general L-amino acid transport system substrate-binding protein